MDKKIILFAAKVVFFLFLTFLVLFFLNIYYEKNIVSKSLVNKKELEYKDYVSDLKKKEIDFVFFGDSHVAGAVNPKYIENSFNYANAGNSYIEIYYKLKKIVEKDRIKVKNVVLEIDPHIFSSRLDDGEYLFRDLWYYSEFVSPDELKEIRERSKLYYYIKSKFPIIGDSIKFGMLFDDDSSTETYLGWNKNKGDYSKQKEKSKAAQKTYSSFFKDKDIVSSVIFEYFQKTLQFSKNNDIKIFFIKCPHSKTYRDILNDNADVQAHYSGLFEKINLAVNDYAVLDFYELYDGQDEYFYDTDHLNYYGANKFSEMLNEKLGNGSVK